MTFSTAIYLPRQSSLGKPDDTVNDWTFFNSRGASTGHTHLDMPSLAGSLSSATLTTKLRSLTERVNIPITTTSPPGLAAAIKQDPWSQAGKYALGWVYFAIILLILTCLIHWYHWGSDKIRRATYKEDLQNKSAKSISPDSDYEMGNLPTSTSTRKLWPQATETPMEEEETWFPNVTFLNRAIALVRFVFYRPTPTLRWKKQQMPLPSGGVIFLVAAAFVFVALYTLLPQPWYYTSIAFGSPPLAIRAGMLAVALLPWIIALSMKANVISMLTGIGHERLNVLHRWAAYIMLFLSLIHMIPFYLTPLWDQGGLVTFKSYFQGQAYIYTTGIAAIVPLLLLCIHSLPMVRRRAYELFVALHVPFSVVFLGMMFWHCHNYLTSWNYLAATAAIWAVSYLLRLFYLNWTNYKKPSWLIGEEAAVTILPENAVKVTIPTQVRWRPGQYMYLRMPGISVFENHPFTIASLNSEDFPSEYGEQYRDMVLVFRPFGGFTRKVLNSAIDKGPYKTYRAFIDGPYGGMTRELASFDTVVLLAGGSGITAIVSQLLDLIKKMREGKAVVKQIQVVWALKRPETMEWFKEELRICRESAPPDSVHCQFFITAAKRQPPGFDTPLPSPFQPVTNAIHDKVNNAFQSVATKRNSALIREEAGGDVEKEKELRRENEDSFGPLPQANISFPPPPTKAHTRKPSKINLPPINTAPPPSQPGFDFGFPSTPTMLQKNLMRFAFLPTIAKKKEGWHTEYGRPDIPFMLKGFEREFGKRTCVFVCGPPSMRVDVARCVAGMQRRVWSGEKEEIYLHTENYAI